MMISQVVLVYEGLNLYKFVQIFKGTDDNSKIAHMLPVIPVQWLLHILGKAN